ncbi:MAG: hypothetical protein JO122_07065 [Acetobacteraceae bacterium]|nr:hypothetical protein [Acetobacteraceae bacterium]
MADESTTAVIQRYLDALPGDRTAELAIRQLVDRAVGKLSLLCVALLHKSYPRLARPPVSLETDELLGGVVAGLLKALRTTRPPTVRRFFALANAKAAAARRTGLPALGIDARAALGPVVMVLLSACCLRRCYFQRQAKAR